MRDGDTVEHKEEEPLEPLFYPSNKLQMDAPWRWLKLGWRDFRRAPGPSLTYGVGLVVFFGVVVWLAWGGAGQNAGQSALSWLLQPRQTADDLLTQRPQSFPNNKSPDFAALEERLAGDTSCIVIEPLPEPGGMTKGTEEAPPAAPLQAAEFAGSIADDWRISSFTGLTRDLHQTFTPAPEPQPDPAFALQYRAGANVGSFLHLLLEKLQLDSAQFSSEAARLAPQLAPRFGLDCDSDSANQLAAWLQDVVASPLKPTNMVGDYGHLQYRGMYFTMNHVPKEVAAAPGSLKTEPFLKREG